MRRIPHLKKVLVGSAFAGAFFLGNPTAGAQELPTVPGPDPASVVAQVRGDIADNLAAAGIQSPQVDAALDDAAHAATTALDNAAAAVNADTYYAEPLTNPDPIGLLEQATQPGFNPQSTDPNYTWKNDAFSKIAAGKPQADYVLHRVPGSFFDAPAIPEESNTAMTQGHSLYGPGTPIYIGQDTMCTLAVAGNDNAGRKVGITAGHCGSVGDSVSSADSWQVGGTGTVVDRNDYLDYSVIEFGSKAQVTRSYNGVTATGLGGSVNPGEVTCKRGVATGTTCGVTFDQGKEVQVNQVCAMVGDSGAPLVKGGRVVGIISRGMVPGLPDCRTPWQGALHNPTLATNTDAILADLNRKGGVGAGFRLPED